MSSHTDWFSYKCSCRKGNAAQLSRCGNDVFKYERSHWSTPFLLRWDPEQQKSGDPSCLRKACVMIYNDLIEKYSPLDIPYIFFHWSAGDSGLIVGYIALALRSDGFRETHFSTTDSGSDRRAPFWPGSLYQKTQTIQLNSVNEIQ